MNRISVGFAVLALGVAGQAFAGPAAIPPIKSETSVLKMNVIGYQGGSNGELTVEVLNPTNSPSVFNAQGLYFIPEENANNAPQRLGAVGPIRVHSGDNWEAKETIPVPASGTIKVKLDVYCIDSHRRAPQTGDKFHLAGSRMPARLSSDIATEAYKAAGSHGGFAAPAAKSAVQSEVWKQRDKKWLKLEGEGKQEATK